MTPFPLTHPVLPASGFQDGVSFQRFKSNFPADATEEDYLEFANEVMQNESLGILQSDADTIVCEIKECIRNPITHTIPGSRLCLEWCLALLPRPWSSV